MNPVRVRFAPSPTGPLHIGGLRTALYNYLLAKQTGGSFILRIEDTDQKRYVEGAEDYIQQTLEWCGLLPDEGPKNGGEYGPYRQSERSNLYQEQIARLLDSGMAYYAFDTEEELTEMREEGVKKGIHSPKYDHSIREQMNNSLVLSKDEVASRINAGVAYVVRLKVDPESVIGFNDIVRSEVKFSGAELDDKVLMKSDGLPTYHFANVVDDHSMKISHVIRGEEWLSSTAHHVLLYKALGWEDEMPEFCHLPLILKPKGKGKLSKRDGAAFGIPVFPMDWTTEEGEKYQGFKEAGFNSKALVNFLALLGWNPGDDKELFLADDLVKLFDLKQIVKSGARFDYDKALWFNQQHIIKEGANALGLKLEKLLAEKSIKIDGSKLEKISQLYLERINNYNALWPAAYYCFEDIEHFDRKNVKKRWKAEAPEHLVLLKDTLAAIDDFSEETIEAKVKFLAESQGLGLGKLLPLLRLGLCGTMSGPSIFGIAEVLGKELVLERLAKAPEAFESVLAEEV